MSQVSRQRLGSQRVAVRQPLGSIDELVLAVADVVHRVPERRFHGTVVVLLEQRDLEPGAHRQR